MKQQWQHLGKITTDKNKGIVWLLVHPKQLVNVTIIDSYTPVVNIFARGTGKWSSIVSPFAPLMPIPLN